jgi:hypothetical protein
MNINEQLGILSAKNDAKHQYLINFVKVLTEK